MSSDENAILCLGEPLVELFATGKDSFGLGYGGDVSNVAVAVARQGGNAKLLTRVGDDHFGQLLRTFWDSERVDTSLVIDGPGEDTGLYFVTYDAAGHHFTYRRNGSAASRLATKDLPVSDLEGAAMFYVSGISLAVSETMREAAQHGVSLAKAHGKFVAVDPNLRTALWPLENARDVTHRVMQDCDIALPGLDDAQHLTGLSDAAEIVRFYHDLGARIVALTLGAEGALVSDGTATRHYTPPQVRAIDATGAGDCFNGIFLSHYLTSLDPFAAAEAATIGSAISTTGRGAISAIPTRSEIQKKKEALK